MEPLPEVDGVASQIHSHTGETLPSLPPDLSEPVPAPTPDVSETVPAPTREFSETVPTPTPDLSETVPTPPSDLRTPVPAPPPDPGDFVLAVLPIPSKDIANPPLTSCQYVPYLLSVSYIKSQHVRQFLSWGLGFCLDILPRGARSPMGVFEGAAGTAPLEGYPMCKELHAEVLNVHNSLQCYSTCFRVVIYSFTLPRFLFWFISCHNVPSLVVSFMCFYHSHLFSVHPLISLYI